MLSWIPIGLLHKIANGCIFKLESVSLQIESLNHNLNSYSTLISRYSRHLRSQFISLLKYPPTSIRLKSSPPRQNSCTKYSLFFVSNAKYNLTMKGWSVLTNTSRSALVCRISVWLEAIRDLLTDLRAYSWPWCWPWIFRAWN